MSFSPSYNEQQTPKELLPVFYQQYGLDSDGGQKRPYVRVELTKKLTVYFPNIPARRKAVLKHDIHHIATGYTSTFKGETEIGAWEIGSGCKHYWIAFILDLHAVMIGLLFNPLGVYKAFVKGRRTRNLYSDTFSDQALMNSTMSALRSFMLLNDNRRNLWGGPADALLFIGLILFGVIYSIFSLLLLPFVLFYSLYVVLHYRPRPEQC